MADTEKRSLKIKANTVNRIVKELQMYENDLVKEQGKYEALKDQGADAHDLKYAEKLLTEASMMIPDTKARLASAVTELEAFLNEVRERLPGAEELEAAAAALQSSQAVLADGSSKEN